MKKKTTQTAVLCSLLGVDCSDDECLFSCFKTAAAAAAVYN